MKKIIAKIRCFTSVHYRLTTINRGRVENIYFENKRLMKNCLKRMPDYEYWTVYKTGPFGIAEREVDFGMIGDVQS